MIQKENGCMSWTLMSCRQPSQSPPPFSLTPVLSMRVTTRGTYANRVHRCHVIASALLQYELGSFRATNITIGMLLESASYDFDISLYIRNTFSLLKLETSDSLPLFSSNIAYY